MKCRICGAKIVYRCRCMRGDSTCENGHTYHWSPLDKEFHEGLSDHEKEYCCQVKKKIESYIPTKNEISR